MSGGAGFLNHQQYHPIELNPYVLLRLFQKFGSTDPSEKIPLQKDPLI